MRSLKKLDDKVKKRVKYWEVTKIFIKLDQQLIIQFSKQTASAVDSTFFCLLPREGKEMELLVFLERFGAKERSNSQCDNSKGGMRVSVFILNLFNKKKWEDEKLDEAETDWYSISFERNQVSHVAPETKIWSHQCRVVLSNASWDKAHLLLESRPVTIH